MGEISGIVYTGACWLYPGVNFLEYQGKEATGTSYLKMRSKQGRHAPLNFPRAYQADSGKRRHPAQSSDGG